MSAKAVIIFSGGMDSTTMLFDMLEGGFTLKALSFDYGQRHKKELEHAKRICERVNVPHEIVDLSSVQKLLGGSSQTDPSVPVPEGHYAEESMKLTVVPNRNMIMLSIAVGHALSLDYDYVAFGAHAGDHTIYPDCRPEFLREFNHVVKVADFKRVAVIAPYMHMNKGEIAVLGKRLKVPYAQTWTCYKGLELHCGKCGACQERKEAFKLNGLVDPTVYMEEGA